MEGCYIPRQERWKHPKMVAVAHTTSPRIPHQFDKCRCVNHLIRFGLERRGGEIAGERNQRDRGHMGGSIGPESSRLNSKPCLVSEGRR